MANRARRLTTKDRARLTDPSTSAILDEARKRGEDRYGARLRAVAAEMQALLAGRTPQALWGAEAVRFMGLRAEVAGLAIEQKNFMEAVAADLLNPGEGSESVN